MFQDMMGLGRIPAAVPNDLNQIVEIILHMFEAALLGAGVSLFYYFTHRKQPVSFSFLLTLPLLCMITGFVIKVIGNDMIRAFGLIGAISMVRFRTRVERTLDMAYIFMAISLGLACGAGLFPAAAAGLLMFGVIVTAAGALKNKIWQKNSDFSTMGITGNNENSLL